MNITVVELVFYVVVSVSAGFLLGQFVKVHVSRSRDPPYSVMMKRKR